MTFAKKLTFTSGLMALSVSSAAFAQDDERYFSGPYISGAIGLEMPEDRASDSIVFDTNGDGTFTDNVNTTTGANAFSPGFCPGPALAPATARCSGNDQDEGYAIRVGYDQQMGDGPFVAGILVEGARPGVEEFTTGFSTTPASYTFGREMDWAVTGRGRLGISPGDGRTLFYATGGAGFAKIERSFATTNGANSFTGDNDSDWEFGYQVGGGAELMLTRNIGLGLEYLYSSFNDDDYTVAVGPGTAPATNPFLIENGGTDMRLSNDRFDYHALRATVNLRF